MPLFKRRGLAAHSCQGTLTVMKGPKRDLSLAIAADAPSPYFGYSSRENRGAPRWSLQYEKITENRPNRIGLRVDACHAAPGACGKQELQLGKTMDAQKVTAATGRPFAIEGDSSVRFRRPLENEGRHGLMPWPTLHAEGITLGNVEWAATGKDGAASRTQGHVSCRRSDALEPAANSGRRQTDGCR